MNRADENLHKQIIHAVNLTLDFTKDIREDVRQMRSEIQRLGDKIDANAAKLNEKIDAHSQVFHEKIDNMANDLRAEIRQRT